MQVQVTEKPLLSIVEASELFGIGQNKLRELTNDEHCTFVLFVGRKRMIKKQAFETYISKAFSI